MPESKELREPCPYLFASPWWFDALAPGSWCEAVVMDGDRPVARLPYVRTSNRGLTRIHGPAVTPHFGPVFDLPVNKLSRILARQKAAIYSLLNQLPEHSVCSLATPPCMISVLPFIWQGFSPVLHYTYRIPSISDIDAVWANMEVRTRTDIRKARKRLNVTTDGSLRDFWNLLCLTFERQGRKPRLSPASLGRLDEALALRQRRLLLFAVDQEGRHHAGAYLAWDDGCAYYLLGGADPALRNSGAQALLLWEAVQLMATRVAVFDFEGSMVETIESFFRGFGAVPIPFYRLVRRRGLARCCHAMRNLLGGRAET